MLAHYEEGFVFVPAVLQPFESDVGDDVCGISGDFLYTVGGVHCGVVVGTLSLQHLPEVETGGVALEVPFSDHRGLVSTFLKQLRKGLLSSVETHSIGQLTVEVAVLAGKDYGPAGGTDGIGDEGAMEDHAFVGDSVDIRSPVPVGSVGGYGLVGVIVGKEEQYVGSLLLDAFKT